MRGPVPRPRPIFQEMPAELLDYIDKVRHFEDESDSSSDHESATAQDETADIVPLQGQLEHFGDRSTSDLPE